METEKITAIASLWPIVLLITLLIIAILFRPQISRLIDRLEKLIIKKGDTVISMNQQNNNTETEEKSPFKNMPEENHKSDRTEEPLSNEKEKKINLDSLSKDDLDTEMMFAFFDNELDRAEEIYNLHQALEKDQNKKYIYNAFYLFNRFRKGDTEALDKLRQLQDATKSQIDANSTVNYFIGMCFKEVSQFENAISAFSDATSLINDEIRKASCLEEISSCYYSLGKKELAFDVLEDGIGKTSDIKALSNLYHSLSKLYKSEEDKIMRAITLEKALEFQPNNTSLLFETAFSYELGELKNLSFYHYKSLIGFSPENEGGLNNLGVICDELKMPIRSTKYYKKAWKLKNSLAAANLAYKYISAGFDDEAQKILTDAKNESDLHPNVGSALAYLSERDEFEEKKEKTIEENGLQQHSFLQNFANNYFSKKNKSIEIGGSWIIDGIKSDFTQQGLQIKGEWGEEKSKKKFTGTLNNTGAILKFEKWGYNLKISDYSFVDDDKGFAYLSNDLLTIYVMKISNDEFTFLTFSHNNQKKDTEDIEVL